MEEEVEESIPNDVIGIFLFGIWNWVLELENFEFAFVSQLRESLPLMLQRTINCELLYFINSL